MRSSISSTLYVGYELPKNFSVELGYSYLGRTRAVLEGVVPANLNQLLADAAHIVRGAGDIVSVAARYRWEVAPRLAVDLRGGPYVWITKTDVSVSGFQALSRTDDGGGYTVGIGPRYALGQHLGLGISAVTSCGSPRRSNTTSDQASTPFAHRPACLVEWAPPPAGVVQW